MKNYLLQLAEQKSFSEKEMKEAVDYILGEEVSESKSPPF